MLRRSILATAAVVVGAALVSATAPLAAETKAPKDATKLKDGIRKLYTKFEMSESIARNEVMVELQQVVAGNKKENALKFPQWWAEQIVEAGYSGDKWVKGTASTKKTEKGDVVLYPKGSDRPVKTQFAYRGPNTYSKTRSAPLLLSFVDSKTDAKAWLEKSWAANEDIAKEWVLAAISESEALDPAKDPIAAYRVVDVLLRQYNVDPNRVFIEGVGSAAKTAQILAATGVADRIAGIILRSPQEFAMNVNAGAFQTIVVHGPEATEKPLAVVSKVNEVCGENHAVALAAPDFATVDGMCQGLVDWLKAAKPRTLAASYSWVTTMDKDGNCPAPFTGTLNIQAPNKRDEPTTVKVQFRRDSNTVDITSTNLGEFVLCLNDDLIDLDKEVVVTVNSKETLRRTFVREVQTLIEQADVFAEYGRVFPVTARVIVQSAAPAAAEKKPEAPAPGPEKK